MHYKEGQKVNFYVDGRKCYYKFTKKRRVGKLEDGTDDRKFYGKLGLYNTSGEHNNSSVTWKNKSD